MSVYLPGERFSKAVRRLKSTLENRQIMIGLSRAQEALARVLGFNDLRHMRRVTPEPFQADGNLPPEELEARVRVQADRLSAFLSLPSDLAREIVLEVRPTGDVHAGAPRFVSTEEELDIVKDLVPSAKRKMYPGGHPRSRPSWGAPNLTNMERAAVLVADYMNEVGENSHERWALACLDAERKPAPLMREVARATAAVFASVRDMDPLVHDFVRHCIWHTHRVVLSGKAPVYSWEDRVSRVLGRRIWEMAMEAVRRWNPSVNPFDSAVRDWGNFNPVGASRKQGSPLYPEIIVDIVDGHAVFGKLRVGKSDLAELVQFALWASGASEWDILRAEKEITGSLPSSRERLREWVTVRSAAPDVLIEEALKALFEPPHPWQEPLGISRLEAVWSPVVFLDDADLAHRAASSLGEGITVHVAKVGLEKDNPELGCSNWPKNTIVVRVEDTETALQLPLKMLRYDLWAHIIDFKTENSTPPSKDSMWQLFRATLNGSRIIFVGAPEDFRRAIVQEFRDLARKITKDEPWRALDITERYSGPKQHHPTRPSGRA